MILPRRRQDAVSSLCRYSFLVHERVDNTARTTYILRVMGHHSNIPVIAQGERHEGRTAIVDSQGAVYTYKELLDASARVAAGLLAGGELFRGEGHRGELHRDELKRDDLQEERVAFLLAPGFPWVAVLWGIWRAGGVAVP